MAAQKHEQSRGIFWPLAWSYVPSLVSGENSRCNGATANDPQVAQNLFCLSSPKAKSRDQPTAHMAMWNRIQQCVPKRPQELCQRASSEGYPTGLAPKQEFACAMYLRAEDFAGDTGVLLHAVPPQCTTAARSFVRVAIFQVYETEAFGRV